MRWSKNSVYEFYTSLSWRLKVSFLVLFLTTLFGLSVEFYLLGEIGSQEQQYRNESQRLLVKSLRAKEQFYAGREKIQQFALAHGEQALRPFQDIDYSKLKESALKIQQELFLPSVRLAVFKQKTEKSHGEKIPSFVLQIGLQHVADLVEFFQRLESKLGYGFYLQSCELEIAKEWSGSEALQFNPQEANVDAHCVVSVIRLSTEVE
ncbi:MULTISPECIES: hypothetical protein [Thiomicrorhabdus]|uniref:Uncharacterized protein n=1 Tax=Thiomicrorhabdus heinhorstiae TaxID=2748010 RepID=A0ABS0C018_9GAMM|nr:MULTISPECIES: hypothetical protein [Thiomicrorhabdus]MBF6058431.1 hypothetical protein [Thiomicrorhabdus heinhorstiae]